MCCGTFDTRRNQVSSSSSLSPGHCQTLDRFIFSSVRSFLFALFLLFSARISAWFSHTFPCRGIMARPHIPPHGVLDRTQSQAGAETRCKISKYGNSGFSCFFFELLIRSPRRIYDRARGFPCCYEEGRSTNQDRVWLVCLPSRRWNFFNFFPPRSLAFLPAPDSAPRFQDGRGGVQNDWHSRAGPSLAIRRGRATKTTKARRTVRQRRKVGRDKIKKSFFSMSAALKCGRTEGIQGRNADWRRSKYWIFPPLSFPKY